jgi:hypothetical protein
MAKPAKCTPAERAQLDREYQKFLDACAEYDQRQLPDSEDTVDESLLSPIVAPSLRKKDQLLALLAHHRKPSLRGRPLPDHRRDDTPAGIRANCLAFVKAAGQRIH